MSWRGRGRGGDSNGYGGGNNSNNFGNRLGGSPLVSVEIRGWEGGTKDDLVGFISRKTHIQLQDAIVSGPLISAKVRPHEAGPLAKWSGVRFAGSALQITLIENNNDGGGLGNANMNGSANNTIDILRTFLYSRYNEQLKMLNLENLKGDGYLIQNGLFATASTASKMFPALMKIAGEESNKTNGLPKGPMALAQNNNSFQASGSGSFVVETVNLASNDLQDVTGITTLAQAFPDLKNLSLADNNIINMRGLEPWRHRFRLLRELILNGNAVTTQPGYKEEIMRMFPRLIMLDGQIIRDESTLDVLKLPMPVKHMFFETPEIQGICTNFLANFFDLFDRDRSQLLQLYDESSTFSISVNSSSPRILLPNAGASQSWSAYIPISRNLQKVTTMSARTNRLAVGSQAIGNVFRRIPPTKHELLQSPEKFAVESWRTNGIKAVGDTGIVASIHGEFTEPQSNNTIRSFDRTFILVQGPSGNMIVATDIMTVRAWSGSDAWKETINSAPSATNTSIPTSSAPQVIPGVSISAPAVPSAVGVPPELSNLQPQQLSIVQKLMQETRLNAQYSRMLAEQANFDLNQAAVLFQQSRAQLPPNAFI